MHLMCPINVVWWPLHFIHVLLNCVPCSTTSWTKWINAAHVVHCSVSGLQLLLSKGWEWPPWYVYCTTAFSHQEKQITQQKPLLTFRIEHKSNMGNFFDRTQILKSRLATKAHLLTRILITWYEIKLLSVKYLLLFPLFCILTLFYYIMILFISTSAVR